MKLVVRTSANECFLISVAKLFLSNWTTLLPADCGTLLIKNHSGQYRQDPGATQRDHGIEKTIVERKESNFDKI